MKLRFLVLLLALTVACGGEEISFTTLAGRKIENATVTRIEGDGVVLMTDSGVEKVSFADMSPELQKKYGHDPAPGAAGLQPTVGVEQITTTTLKGRQIVKATVTRVEPDGLVLNVDGGIEKVYFAELDPQIREQFGYDPAKAAAFVQARRASIAQSNAQAKAVEQAELRQKKQDAKAAMKAAARINGQLNGQPVRKKPATPSP